MFYLLKSIAYSENTLIKINKDHLFICVEVLHLQLKSIFYS